jgi:hypothetical protein
VNTTRSQLFTLATTIIALSLSAWLAGVEPVTSHWKDQPIEIDGSSAEWPVLTPLDDSMAVAAANDARDLYVAVATSDVQRRRQLAMLGLIVWIDVAGGKKETYGIRIPGSGFQMPAGRFGGAAGDAPRAPEPPAPRITYIELLGPKKDDRRRLELRGESAIAVAAGVSEGTLVYEVRLPLAASTPAEPYGIGAKTNRTLGLGLQIPKPERPEGGAPRGGGVGGFGGRGGRGGPDGFGGGRGGGGMRGRGPMEMNELKLWTTLTLATRIPAEPSNAF